MGTTRRRLVLVLMAALVCQGVAVSSSNAAASGDLDPDSVLVHVSLQEEGDATWRVEYRYLLRDANDSAAFDALESEIDDDPAAAETRFHDRLDGAVRAAADQTGRPMRLGAVAVSTRTQSLPQNVGIVSYRVRWHGFAAVTPDGLDAGGPLRGFYLAPRTTLTLSWPATFALGTSVPAADVTEATRLTWQGERQFVGEEPVIALVPRESVTTTPTGTATDAASSAAAALTTKPDPDESSVVSPPSAALGVLALGIVFGVAVWRRRAAARPPSTLVSDEERVLAVLQAEGGRVRQAELADTYDWTASKTSKIVNRMQEAETVAVFRLGRENVVTLPEEGLTDD